jgi:hypothetical protein
MGASKNALMLLENILLSINLANFFLSPVVKLLTL